MRRDMLRKAVIMKSDLISVLHEAGKIVLGAHHIAENVSEKFGNANFVTEYDSAVQAFLFAKLSELVPDASFVGEEDGADSIESLTADSGLAFVIDPIDGTQNFIKNLRQSVISVALAEGGKTILGAIYNPYSDELFYADRGKGAVLIHGGEQKPLHVSENSLSQGIVLFGSSPYYRNLSDASFADLHRLFTHALDMRRFGAAAWDFCLLADGRAEVFFEHILSPWDYAAGMLILAEAGGVVTTMDGGEVILREKCSILAGNPAAHADAMELLKRM